MRTMIAMAFLLLAAALTGCGEANVDLRGLRVPGTSEPDPPPNPAADPRTAAELQNENARLRQTLAELEKNHRDWQAAVERKKDEVELLKDRRDVLKKQRERAKDALDD